MASEELALTSAQLDQTSDPVLGNLPQALVFTKRWAALELRRSCQLGLLWGQLAPLASPDCSRAPRPEGAGPAFQRREVEDPEGLHASPPVNDLPAA